MQINRVVCRRSLGMHAILSQPTRVAGAVHRSVGNVLVRDAAAHLLRTLYIVEADALAVRVAKLKLG